MLTTLGPTGQRPRNSEEIAQTLQGALREHGWALGVYPEPSDGEPFVSLPLLPGEVAERIAEGLRALLAGKRAPLPAVTAERALREALARPEVARALVGALSHGGGGEQRKP
ncbi:hypothetical protein RKE29_10650 [Streptomyces sp. B1866]|uniref:hypothetical protein n=1 Tax=Streptomyces sp. B1866 TaxID=3075431 RepID=UPI00288E3DBA|nr:hypothetical protein [Streptomyces sp. B1866]MDT3397100.1 hypothetical protein [Streptomyces sp. B1866]